MSSVKSVVISCAGIGSRLGLGQTKALIKINGKSLIAWQLDLFKDVEDVRIVVPGKLLVFGRVDVLDVHEQQVR